MEFDNYAVTCVRDDEGEERFVIWFVSVAQNKTKTTFGPFTEVEVRAEMEKMGLSHAEIGNNIQRAHEHAEQKP